MPAMPMIALARRGRTASGSVTHTGRRLSGRRAAILGGTALGTGGVGATGGMALTRGRGAGLNKTVGRPTGMYRY